MLSYDQCDGDPTEFWFKLLSYVIVSLGFKERKALGDWQTPGKPRVPAPYVWNLFNFLYFFLKKICKLATNWKRPQKIAARRKSISRTKWRWVSRTYWSEKKKYLKKIADSIELEGLSPMTSVQKEKEDE